MSIGPPSGVTVLQSIHDAPAGVVELYRRGEAQLQFDQTLDWLQLLEAHALGPQERVTVVVATGEEAVLGVLPLRHDGIEGWTRWREGRALATYYSSLYAPVLPDDGTLVFQQLLAGVQSLTPAVHSLDLNPLSTQMADVVEAALQRAGWPHERYFRFGNWYLDVAGRSYSEYFAGLPSQLRNTVTRKRKKFMALSGASLSIAATPAEAEEALEAYQSIYAGSWKQPEPHPEFVPSLVRKLAQRGWLRLGVARADGVPIAAQIWAVKDGVASIFKLAYDERSAKLSAGSILTAHLMERAIDADRVRIVDYLTGDDAYKQDWMSHRQERWGVRAYNPKRLRALLAAVVASGRRFLRARGRRSAAAT